PDRPTLRLPPRFGLPALVGVLVLVEPLEPVEQPASRPPAVAATPVRAIPRRKSRRPGIPVSKGVERSSEWPTRLPPHLRSRANWLAVRHEPRPTMTWSLGCGEPACPGHSSAF